MKKKIVIIGGGMNGMIAACILKDFEPIIIESKDTLGGNWGMGGIQYLHDTPRVREFLDGMKVSFNVSKVKAGIVFTENSQPDDIDFVVRRYSNFSLIQKRHYAKSRGTLVGFSDDCMNDHVRGAVPNRIDCDTPGFFSGLPATVDFRLGAKISLIDGTESGLKILIPETAHGTSPVDLVSDRIITTIPATEFDKILVRVKRNGNVEENCLVQKEKLRVDSVRYTRFKMREWYASLYSEYDYVYTVSTPYNAVYRISKFKAEGGWEFWAESRADVSHTVVEADLFAMDGLKGVQLIEHKVIPTRIIRPEQPLAYPENIFPLGRFAEFEPRSLLSTSIEKCYNWEQQWKI